MIKYASKGQESIAGKRVAISGSGNVAQFAALKTIELGGTVVSLSDSQGALIATSDGGFTPEQIGQIAALKVERKQIASVAGSGPFADKVKYIAGARPFIAEGSNMGCTQAAIDVFEAHRQANPGTTAIWYAPGKAANAGGVAVSGLEMAQNSARLSWTSNEVDAKLKGIMESIFHDGLKTALKYVTPHEGVFPSLVAGSNIAGFTKVADAMKDHGDWW